MNYKQWLITVKKVIDIRFKDEDTSKYKQWADWDGMYNSKMTAHEAVTLSGHS